MKKIVQFLAVIALIPVQPVFGQDADQNIEEDADQNIEEVVVTGSRIIRTDKFAEAGHILAIDEIAIDAMAELNVADVLRTSPLNTHGSFNERSGSSAQSNATINLRGLGDWRTLVLVDGTRVPGSPNLAAQTVNINMLPNIAVRRIDILADGASAVYGSDAMAGVVNYVLHRDFEGVEVSARYGDRSRDDGGDQAVGLLAGLSTERGNLVFAFEYSHRDVVYDRDRWFTEAKFEDEDGNGRIDIYDETVGVSYYGQTWEIFDPNTGYYGLQPAVGCPDTDGFVGEVYFAAFGLPSESGCGYAFANIATNRAELEKINAYLYGSFDVSEDSEAYLRVMFAKNKTFGRYAPPAADWPSPPADHPHNPFDLDDMIAQGLITDQAFLWGYYRWTNVGPRASDTTDFLYDIVAGTKGEFANGVHYDFYAQKARYDADDLGRYYLSYTGLDYVLANQIDPFSPEGANAMRAETWQDNFTTQLKLYGHLQMDAWDVFGAGDSILLLGVEYADVDYYNQIDPASEAGEVGGSAGVSNGGKRSFTSAFFEYALPINDGGEINIAGRYDNYSDFGGTFNPSIGFAQSITDSLTFRARWGEGFVAPDMVSLFGPSDEFQAVDYDPVIDAVWAFTVHETANEALQPETSTSLSAGLTWEYLDGHSVDLTWFKVEIENVITYPRYWDVLYAEFAGIALDPNGVRTERIGGFLTDIYVKPVNANRQEVSGIDLQLSSSFDTGLGYFGIGALYSYQLAFKENAFFQGGYQDTRNFDGRPDTRGQLTLSWSLGDHGLHLTGNYIGRHAADEELDSVNGLIERSPESYDDWITANVSYGYDAKQWGRIRIGANNVFDEDPVINPVWDFAGPSNLYDTLGRVIFMEYKKTFD